jgi:prevent-host-death family protein
MAEVSVHEAKTHFSRLLKRAATGEEIVILRSGKPVARLVPMTSTTRRTFGVDRGRFDIPEGFDEPLPDEVLRSFEGPAHE